MFSFLKKQGKIISPMSGDVIAIEKIQDQAFSQKILGDGFGVIPNENTVYSPVNGKVVKVFDTKHAVCIETDDNLEILIHLGIDTVTLAGEGFDVFVKEGDDIKTGDKIMSMDIDFIKSKNLHTTCCVILTNHDILSNLKILSGSANGGKSVAAEYKMGK